jgi:hypothetical protein
VRRNTLRVLVYRAFIHASLGEWNRYLLTGGTAYVLHSLPVPFDLSQSLHGSNILDFLSVPSDQSQSLNRNISQHRTNHRPSLGIYRSIRPITVPHLEYTAESDQSQPLNRIIPQHPPNHRPSIGINCSVRPITVSQWEYTAASDQSQSLNGNIPQHPTNDSPSIGTISLTHLLCLLPMKVPR